MRALSKTALIGLLVSIPLRAPACPDCPAGIRKQVYAGILDETFSRNLATAALPFGLLAGIAAAIHLGLFARGRRHG